MVDTDHHFWWSGHFSSLSVERTLLIAVCGAENSPHCLWSGHISSLSVQQTLLITLRGEHTSSHCLWRGHCSSLLWSGHCSSLLWSGHCSSLFVERTLLLPVGGTDNVLSALLEEKTLICSGGKQSQLNFVGGTDTAQHY